MTCSESRSNGGAIVPGLRWDILNYGRLKNNVAVQNSRLEQAVTNYRHTVLSANSEVEDALTDFTKKKEQLLALQRAVAALQESVDLAVSQYRAGDVDLDRVNNLRKELIAQLDVETSVRGLASIALIKVYKTMGGGWALPSSNQCGICKSESPGPTFLDSMRATNGLKLKVHEIVTDRNWFSEGYSSGTAAMRALPMEEGERDWSVSLFLVDSHKHNTGDEPIFCYCTKGIEESATTTAQNTRYFSDSDGRKRFASHTPAGRSSNFQR